MNAPVNPNKALWEKGDFTRIAATMRESGETLVEKLGITKGMQVLDLGCGDGTTALPEAIEVAKEMVRVTRPGGRIVMGNWIPNDPTFVAQLLKISSNYTPPPPEGFVSPMTWGVESNVIERFAAAGVSAENISFARDTFTFNFPGTPSAYVDEFRKYYGPTINAFEAAEKQGRAAELQKELEELFNSQNKSQNATMIPATFLRVTVAV